MEQKPRYGYMCKTDFDFEVGEASNGVSVYKSKEDCLANLPCVTECGIVKVKITFEKNILKSNMFKIKK
jgi:hypothetical protein